MRTGHYAVVEQLAIDGVTHIFGNPGTVEQGFLDALGDFPAVDYVLTLQESVAVMAADAHARARRGLAVAQIHSSPGLGNAIGALYQAKRGHSPILVIGGDAGVRYQAMEAQMAADLVAMARPVTKWSTMVLDPSSLLRVLRRAVKIATTPPMGPVYVCLPQDILSARARERALATVLPSTRSSPEPALIDQAARALAEAATPMIYVGDGVAWSGAQAEIGELAELIGAEVWGVDCGELNLAADHPLWMGQTGHMFGEQSLPVTHRGDVNLVVGTYMVPEVFPELGDIFADGACTIHVDLDADQIGKNHPVALGMVADPKTALAALIPAVKARRSAEKAAAASLRAAVCLRAKADRRARELAEDEARAGQTPLAFATFAAELAKQIPPGAAIFDEALTNSPALNRHLPPRDPAAFFQTRGGSLGSALAGGLGLAAAAPDRPVVAVSGDGGAMYVIQALWTAARHHMNVKFVICNNRSYRLLQLNIDQFWKESGIAGRPYPISFDLSRPQIGFAALARGLGVEAARVETREQIAPALAAAFASQEPYLIDVAIAGDVHPDLIGLRCGQ